MTMATGREKVLSLEQLASLITGLKKVGKTIALCHGCFDILHTGHLRHFESAKKNADILVVTVTPDRFINKGPDRPVFPENQRVELVAGLEAVNFAAVNSWDTAIETLKLLRPNFFVKGQEYETRATEVNPNFLLEQKIVEEIDAQMIFTYEFTSSSTSAFKKLMQ